MTPLRETPPYSEADQALAQSRRLRRGRGHCILASDVYQVCQWASCRARRPHVPGWVVVAVLLVLAIAIKVALGAR